MAEPGRFMASTCFDLVLTVQGVKKRKDKEGNIVHIDYYLSDGVYGWMHNQMVENFEYDGIAIRQKEND